jgi:hypothetical protein
VPRDNFYVADESAAGVLAAHAQCGDILLFSTTQIDSYERASRAFQGAYFPADAAAYSHAAIYVGNDEVIHAVPVSKGSNASGVRIDNLRTPSICVGYVVCLLRWPAIMPVYANQIEVEARSLASAGAKYDYGGISGGVWQTFVDWMQLKPEQGRRWVDYVHHSSRFAPLYCSKLVLVVYFNALGSVNPLGRGHSRCPIYTPAEIYCTFALDDVRIRRT